MLPGQVVEKQPASTYQLDEVGEKRKGSDLGCDIFDSEPCTAACDDQIHRIISISLSFDEFLDLKDRIRDDFSATNVPLTIRLEDVFQNWYTFV
jgi:hypothetical protein